MEKESGISDKDTVCHSKLSKQLYLSPWYAISDKTTADAVGFDKLIQEFSKTWSAHFSQRCFLEPLWIVISSFASLVSNPCREIVIV